MNRIIGLLISMTVLTGGIWLSTKDIHARSQAAEHKTVWTGVYTDAEATRGQAIFTEFCTPCHGIALEGGASMGGPPLAGDKFLENWREDTVGTLFTKIRTTMPRRGFQGSEKVLTDREALDLIAYIFKTNAFPSGSELSPTNVTDVWIEQKDGPKPLPNYAQVQVVGCMEQDAANWVLNKAAQPSRLRGSGDKVDPAVLQAAQTKALGGGNFRLQNLVMLGAFQPEAHKGHRMLAQGVLIRQGGIERISVTQLEMVAANCQ